MVVNSGISLYCASFRKEVSYLCFSFFFPDRKAVVSKGSLRCCGSSLFLKNRFGLGYHLKYVDKFHMRENKQNKTTTTDWKLSEFIHLCSCSNSAMVCKNDIKVTPPDLYVRSKPTANRKLFEFILLCIEFILLCIEFILLWFSNKMGSCFSKMILKLHPPVL